MAAFAKYRISFGLRKRNPRIGLRHVKDTIDPTMALPKDVWLSGHINELEPSASHRIVQREEALARAVFSLTS